MQAYNSYKDDLLLTLLVKGDEAAFTELYNRYWERMVIVAYVKLQSSEDAREVVQDIFLDLWSRREHLQVLNSFHTYISGAVKYKIFTLLAKNQKDRFKYKQAQGDLVSCNTEEWLSYEHLRGDLEKAVLELPEKCRIVFRLSREAGLSGREIATHLNISHKTVESHLTKALSHLRTALKSFFLFLF